MTTQIALKTITNVRDDHFAVNPVSAAVERFILLERSHYSTSHGKDQWIAGSGGSNAGGTLFSAALKTYPVNGPFNTSKAALISSTASTAGHFYRAEPLAGNGNWQGFLGEAANGQWAFAYLLKAGTITQVDIEYVGPTGSTLTHRFDLSTGSKVSGSDNTVRIAAASPGTPTNSGWYWIYSVGAKLPASITSNSTRSFLYMVKGGQQSWAGTTADDLHFGGVWTEYNAAMCSRPSWDYPTTGILWGQSHGQDLLIVSLPSTLSAPQAMTVYMEWLDRGNGIMAGASVNATTPGIFRIGGVTNTAANSVNVTQTSTGFSGTYNNGGSTSVSTVALVPDVGDLVALRAVLDATGALTLYAGKNGAAETAGTTGTSIGFPGAWDAAEITPNSLGGTNAGDMELRKMHVAPGVVSAAALAAL